DDQASGQQDLLDQRNLRGQRGRDLLAAVGGQPVRLVGGHGCDPEGPAPSRAGCRARTSRVIMSSSPRTALTGVPSGARTVSGTPKNARKYSEAVSSNISEPTLPSCHGGPAGQDNSTTLPSMILICLAGSGLRAGPGTTAPSVILN